MAVVKNAIDGLEALQARPFWVCWRSEKVVVEWAVVGGCRGVGVAFYRRERASSSGKVPALPCLGLPPPQPLPTATGPVPSVLHPCPRCRAEPRSLRTAGR